MLVKLFAFAFFSSRGVSRVSVCFCLNIFRCSTISDRLIGKCIFERLFCITRAVLVPLAATQGPRSRTNVEKCKNDPSTHPPHTRILIRNKCVARVSLSENACVHTFRRACDDKKLVTETMAANGCITSAVLVRLAGCITRAVLVSLAPSQGPRYCCRLRHEGCFCVSWLLHKDCRWLRHTGCVRATGCITGSVSRWLCQSHCRSAARQVTAWFALDMLAVGEGRMHFCWAASQSRAFLWLAAPQSFFMTTICSRMLMVGPLAASGHMKLPSASSRSLIVYNVCHYTWRLPGQETFF